MEYHRLDGLNKTEIYFLTALKTKSKIKVAAGLMSGKSTPLGLQATAFLLCTYMAFLGAYTWRVGKFSDVSS